MANYTDKELKRWQSVVDDFVKAGEALDDYLRKFAKENKSGSVDKKLLDKFKKESGKLSDKKNKAMDKMNKIPTDAIPLLKYAKTAKYI